MRQRLTWGSGIAISMGVGVATGSALDNMGVGIGIGIAIGLVFAIAIGSYGRRISRHPEDGAEGGSDDSSPADDGADSDL